MMAGKLHGAMQPCGGSIRGLALQSDGPLLASVGLDRYLRLHNTATRKTVHKVYLKQQLTGDFNFITAKLCLIEIILMGCFKDYPVIYSLYRNGGAAGVVLQVLDAGIHLGSLGNRKRPADSQSANTENGIRRQRSLGS